MAGNSGKGSGKIPARAHNPKRIANRAASYKRGQERKDARRLAQSKRERANKALQLEGKLTKWEAITAAQHDSTRNKLFNVGTAQFVMSNPVTSKLAKGQMNPGRSVSITTTQDNRRNVIGWGYSCFNCRAHKSYLNQYFQDSYGMAVKEGHDHMCAPQVWRSPHKELLASR